MKFWQRGLLSPLKRRWLPLLLSLITLACIAIPVALSQQPVTLRLLMTAPDVPPWRDNLVKAFNEQQNRIRLEVVEGPNSPNLIEDLYTTAFLLGNSPYDLVNMDVTWAAKFASAGWLQDLTDEFSEAELAPFSPQDIEGGKYNGRLYRIPVRSDAGVLYYRKDLIDKAGLQPPQSFPDIIKISKEIQQRGLARWGYLWQGRQYCHVCRGDSWVQRLLDQS